MSVQLLTLENDLNSGVNLVPPLTCAPQYRRRCTVVWVPITVLLFPTVPVLGSLPGP